MSQPRYSKEEHARRGYEVYDRMIRDQVEADNHGRIVAIDVDSGQFEVADTSLAAAKPLLTRLPQAQIWCIRMGYPAVHRFKLRSQASG